MVLNRGSVLKNTENPRGAAMIKNSRMLIVVSMLLIIGGLNYALAVHGSPIELVYRELYLIPIFLGATWFGKKGGLITSVSASAVFIPCVVLCAPAGGALFVSNFIQLLLFNLLGACFGILRDNEKRREKERLDAVMALAGSVGHELNNPLSIAMQCAEILQEELDLGSEHQDDLKSLVDALERMKNVIKKITKIERIELTHYVGNCYIVDIEKSTRLEDTRQDIPMAASA